MSIENLGPGDFGRGTKKRLPICFCLDASGSMEGERMDCLNEAIQNFVRINEVSIKAHNKRKSSFTAFRMTISAKLSS